ncbi:extracellular solute-binding protein [Nitrogeniibacter mangrovi]|uniref:Extracellular solute-binding protein n=1 Tax=Nitrogeniibacter mangrovi TaxID=2016596 RepID=A0A6C1B3B1_9RHOO|nr:extracellular solute-binding protein [Nitrogeniibacter mangrovi]QID18126.1 extracellular solute-binding protein [Nitrogeniibacter mangrovi]
MRRFRIATLLVTLLTTGTAMAEVEQVVNLYTSRHYQSDEALYANFTQATGIRVNRIEGKDDALIERIRNEGKNSPADVLLTADASRLGKAAALGLLAPLDSSVLAARIPAHLRTDTWFAFSRRARIIVYNKQTVKPEQVRNYEDLASPALKGKVCTRSGAHPYNLSLGASLLQRLGADATAAWASGLVANFARQPKGGDTDQIRAVAAGECGVALANSYYFARLMNSDKPADRAVIAAVGVVWPNQANVGTHVNISGGGMTTHAPNKAAARAFLEYLASDEAQRHFANGNNEWPAVADVKVANPALEALGPFKADPLPVAELADAVPEVQRLYDRAGYR